VNETAFGEVVFGRRIASDLLARGDRAVFLAPRAHARLLDGIEHVPLAPGDPRPDRRVVELTRELHPASVVLFDATSVLIAFEQQRVSPRFLQRLGCPVIAHECWNLGRTGLRIDMGPGFWPIPRTALGFARRLLPVPASAPLDGAGTYDALPRLSPISRRAARRALGLTARERAVLMATAWFQEPELHGFEPISRWARALPELIGGHLAQLPKNTRIFHVGPRAWPALGRRLTDRYHHLAQGPFDARLLSAADALLSFNLTASTVGSAIAARLPVMMGTCSRPISANGTAATPRLRRWLAKHAPLHPFHVWPCGFHAFLAPLLAKNPYNDTFASVEVIDEVAFVETLNRMLGDPAFADGLREHQARYESQVRRLPSAANLLERWLR
jgi:hypothetical protein